MNRWPDFVANAQPLRHAYLSDVLALALLPISRLGIGEHVLAYLDPYRDTRRTCFAFQLCGASFL